MANLPEDRVLPLAGMVQAAQLVLGAAQTGMVSQDSFEATIRSLFVFDPESTIDVYGGIDGIKPGLRTAGEMFTRFNLEQHADLARYVFSMMSVERALAERQEMLEHIGAALRQIHAEQAGDSGATAADNVISAVAALYQATISTMQPRIKIVGSRHHLKNEYNISRIRALLLAGIRSAVLWRQMGGRRRQLLLSRKRMNHAVSKLIGIP